MLKQYNQQKTRVSPEEHQQLNQKSLPPRLHTKQNLLSGGTLRKATVNCSLATPSNNASLNH